MTNDSTLVNFLRAQLAIQFNSEWFALSAADKALIVRDCTEDGSVDDIVEYRRNIGTGNLAAYVECQRGRFAK